MKLFGYYAWHSFINQLRKLLKSWVLIFFAVCLLLGGLIGFGAAMLEEAANDSDTSITESETIEEEEIIEIGDDNSSGIDVETLQFVELIAGGAILAVFVFQSLGADKNGSKIFMPPDVNLLFSSPMKPQSVLLFRLTTQLGAIILASVYLLFQLPNLVFNLGASIWAALAAIATWCLTIVMGKLLQILLYIVCSTHIKMKSYLRNGIYILLVLLFGAYILYWKTCGSDPLTAAISFFNAPVTRFIPLWGWLKGFCMFAFEGNTAAALLSLGAVVASGVLLAYITWNMKADFYEDAMAKSEETAELLERARSEKAGAVVRAERKKDRSDRLRRDGMRYGSGANVFFFKAMYNRFRFAHLGVFTKTAETYLIAAAGVAALCRFVIGTDTIIPAILTLTVFTFYRSLGNPLAQDTQMNHFLLIPESSWSKLFWSLMGGTANCFLDLLPAVIVSALLLGANPLTALAWIPLIISVDFFSTTVGTFIGLSVPVSAGKMIKQIVQVMFIYFGLLPDIAIMAVALTFGHAILGAVICTLINILLGLLFFALTPLFLEPKSKKPYTIKTHFSGDFKIAKKQFSILGLGAFSILIISTVAQILIAFLLNAVWPGWAQHPWGMWIGTQLPMYLVAVPIGLLIFRKAPATPLEKHSLKPGRFAVTAIISIFMMYAGNYTGIIITTLLQLIPGVSTYNPVIDFATNSALLPRALFMVILAPIIEEYIFRKQFIDRMHIYGQRTAVLTSALLFGLFHGNLSQFFYAFALGLVFGYIYLKTGKLRYSIGLHMLINFLGSVIAPLLLEKLSGISGTETMNVEALKAVLPWMIGLMAYSLTMIGLAIAGLVLLCINKRKITYTEAELELPHGKRFTTVYLNVGMILLIAACLFMFVTNIV